MKTHLSTESTSACDGQELLPHCEVANKISHATIVSAQSHCNRLKDAYPKHQYRWYVCSEPTGTVLQHYHVATTDASVGSLLRSGGGYTGVEKRKAPRSHNAEPLQGGFGNMIVQITKRLHADRGSIFLYNAATGMLDMTASIGLTADMVLRFCELDPASDYASARAFTQNQNIMLADVKLDGSATYQELLRSAGLGCNSVVVVPLNYEGNTLGTVGLVFNQVHKPSMYDMFKLDIYAHQIAYQVGDQNKRTSAAAGK